MGGIAMVLIGLVFRGSGRCKRGKGAGRFNLFIVPLRSGICHLGRAPEKQPGFQGHCLQFYDPRYGRSAFPICCLRCKRRFRRAIRSLRLCLCVRGISYFELQKGVTEPEGLILPACAAGGCWGGGKKRARRTENPRGGKFSAPRLAANPPTSEGHRTLCAARPGFSGFPPQFLPFRRTKGQFRALRTQNCPFVYCRGICPPGACPGGQTGF